MHLPAKEDPFVRATFKETDEIKGAIEKILKPVNTSFPGADAPK